MMPPKKPEKGIQENGESNRQKGFKWIYLFTLLISISMLFSFLIFKGNKDIYDLEPLKSEPAKPKPLKPVPLKPKPLKRKPAFYPPITFSKSDEEFSEHEVFAEFKDDEIDFLNFDEIKKDLASDFIGKLKEVPMRLNVPVGIVKRGDSNYASTVIQALFRFPMIRKVLANLEIYNEYHEFHLKKLKEERDAIAKTKDSNSLDQAYGEIEIAKEVAGGLNSMFSRLQSSERNLVKFHSEALLKLNFLDNFSNFKLIDNYFSKLIEYVFKFIPESQRKHLLVQFKDTCYINDSSDEEDEIFEKAILKLDFTENENTLSDLMRIKFLQFRKNLEWKGPLVRVSRQSKLFYLPNMAAIQISRISSGIDKNEITDDDKRCGYHGPIALEKRLNGKCKGTYEINDQSIEMPLKFDFAPYFDGNISLNRGTTYNLKMFITCEEFEFEKKIGKEIDKTLVYSLIVKENDSKWYKIQDKKIAEVTVNSDNLNFGYIYFYEQECS